jgi:hypothetical protein
LRAKKGIRFKDRKISKLGSQWLKARDMPCATKNFKLDSLKISVISKMKMVREKREENMNI